MTEEAKTPKLVKADQKFWLGSAPCRKGHIYDALRHFVHSNPGMTRAELVASAALKEAMSGSRNPEARKQAVVDDAYVSGYLTGGIRRGYLVDSADKAATEIAFVEEGKAVSDKAPAGEVTKAGREFLDTLAAFIAAKGAAPDTPVSAKTIEEHTGKNLSMAARTLSKLEQDGYIDIERLKDEAGEPTKKVASIKILKMPAAAPTAPAGE